jgi:signal transduction histidine kinase
MGAGWLQWIGTLGPWDRVAESGRALFDAAQPELAANPELSSAVERHQRDLSESLVQAGRWRFLGDRAFRLLPFFVGASTLILGAAALWLSRRLSRELSRPIRELVDWADRMARGEQLPESGSAEKGEVTEVRSLRQALRSASVQIDEGRTRALENERIRAWGEMARRVAHEMKNPLTPLRLAAHRLQRHAPEGEDMKEAIAVIGEETGRLEELARQFAVLGRPSAGRTSPVDLEELLASLLASDVPDQIERSLAVAAGTSLIEAHYDALLRAFRNLLRNAVESVTTCGGGRIDVRVVPAGNGVEVTVSDTGKGIAPELAERIFDPDFTLKAGGTGLGLAVVRQAVAAHGGVVSARPRHGGGAEFLVRLPAAPSGARTLV